MQRFLYPISLYTCLFFEFFSSLSCPEGVIIDTLLLSPPPPLPLLIYTLNTICALEKSTFLETTNLHHHPKKSLPPRDETVLEKLKSFVLTSQGERKESTCNQKAVLLQEEPHRGRQIFQKRTNLRFSGKVIFIAVNAYSL